MFGHDWLMPPSPPPPCWAIIGHANVITKTFFFYQLFWTQACPERINVHEWDSGPMRGAILTQSHNLLAVKVDYSTRVYDPYSFRIVMWVLLCPTRTNQGKCCETGPMVFHHYLQGSKFKFEFGSTCATRCKFLGALPKFWAHSWKFYEHSL